MIPCNRCWKLVPTCHVVSRNGLCMKCYEDKKLRAAVDQLVVLGVSRRSAKCVVVGISHGIVAVGGNEKAFDRAVDAAVRSLKDARARIIIAEMETEK